MIKFNPSTTPTIGVEIELQLIEDNTLDLKNIAPKVIKAMDKNFNTNSLDPSFEEDLAQSITEDIYGEWDTWEPTPPNIHMLYINFLSE